MIDTGSVENIIPMKIAYIMNLQTTRLLHNKKVEIAKWDVIIVSRHSGFIAELQNDTHSKYKSRFYIIENPHEHPIFLMRFFIENSAIIYLKENVLIVDVTEYEISSNINARNISDKKIIEKKTKVYPITGH